MKISWSRSSVVALAILLSHPFCPPPARAAGCPTPSFAAARSYNVGLKPYAVAVGDFNRDGKPDLAVPIDPDGTVSVLLNNGDGSFASAANYRVGARPDYPPAVGDFNGDGNLDLVLANYGSNNVSVLLGRPDGSFADAVNYTVASSPTHLAAGDFNGDGKLDMIVAANGGLFLMLGNGDGTFQSGVNAGGSPGAITVDDFNGDGKLDVAVGSGGLLVMLGNGDGTFPNVEIYNNGTFISRAVAKGDYNGDGKPDLVLANSTGESVSVFLNNGDGTFKNPVTYPAGANPFSVEGTDLDGDGKLDLVVTSTDAQYQIRDLVLLLGKGDGTFRAPMTYRTVPDPFSTASSDFDGDGHPDLAVVGYFSSNISILLGKGDGTFHTAADYVAGPNLYGFNSAAAGDFNSDGKLDLAVANDGYGAFSLQPGGVSVLLGGGDGSFQAPVNYVAGVHPFTVATADFDRDGKLDLVVGSSTNLSVLLGNGDGTFQAAVSYPAGFSMSSSVHTGDFNGDGKLDVLWGGNGGSLMLGNGDGTLQTRLTLNTNLITSGSVIAGDFNGDGKPDIAAAGYTNISVVLGKGDGTFADPVSYSVGKSPAYVETGDFNGDGKPDLAVANAGSTDSTGTVTNSSVSILVGHGDGTFESFTNYPTTHGNQIQRLAVADFNGDGKADLALVGAGSGTIAILSGNGDATFQPAVNYDSAATFVTAGDFNGDGKADLIGGSIDGITVLLNTCALAGFDLSILGSGTAVRVSWPFPATGYFLESTTNLDLSGWQPVVATPTTNQNRVEVTVPSDGRERYFRLHKP